MHDDADGWGWWGWGVEGGVGEVVMWDASEFAGLCGFNHGRCFEH